jgi:hypothetical protein
MFNSNRLDFFCYFFASRQKSKTVLRSKEAFLKNTPLSFPLMDPSLCSGETKDQADSL